MATVPMLPVTPSISTCREAPCQQHQHGVLHDMEGPGSGAGWGDTGELQDGGNPAPVIG